MRGQSVDILELANVKKYYPLYRGLLRRVYGFVKAVDGVSFVLKKGETLGLVGESGCGKTSLAKCILRLEPVTEGDILFDGVNICELRGEELRRLRRQIQIIFQDPFASLNPVMTAKKIIAEPLIIHGLYGRDAKRRQSHVERLMTWVDIDPSWGDRLPGEFSGGQRQRIAIARALSLSPNLLICDEPVSALDVSTQRDIVELLARLQAQLSLSYLFISHDLGVVRRISNRVAVMYLGKVVEFGNTEDVWSQPLHPYTRLLFMSASIGQRVAEVAPLANGWAGEVRRSKDWSEGCAFYERCGSRLPARCDQNEPPEVAINGSRSVKCFVRF